MLIPKSARLKIRKVARFMMIKVHGARFKVA